LAQDCSSIPKIGISRACRVLNISRSSSGYKSIKDDSTLELLLQQLATNHTQEGYWKYYDRLRNAGHTVNHKRVYRVYKKLNLSIRRKAKKRLPARVKEPLVIPTTINQTWSMDFTSDALSNKTKFRSFNIIDDYNREILFIESDYSLKSSRVLWVLRHLINKQGKPQKIRMDNGPEFIAKMMQQWSALNQIEFMYIQPGKPMQNGFIERFNRTFRESVLDAYLFDTIDEVREQTAVFMNEYNYTRPHDALGGLSPIMYKQKNCSNNTTTLNFENKEKNSWGESNSNPVVFLSKVI
jgi:putative transposase